jgi:hypothetical protein
MIVPVVIQDAARIAFGVVILIAAYRVDEGNKADTTKDQGNRDQVGQDFHRVT